MQETIATLGADGRTVDLKGSTFTEADGGYVASDPSCPTPVMPEGIVVRAHARYVRSSARKARLVCDNIRGKSVDEARTIDLAPSILELCGAKRLENIQGKSWVKLVREGDPARDERHEAQVERIAGDLVDLEADRHDQHLAVHRSGRHAPSLVHL